MQYKKLYEIDCRKLYRNFRFTVKQTQYISINLLRSVTGSPV